MNVSVSFLNGFGEGLPKAAAYDPALTLAVTGLGTLTGAQALVHTLDGETALSDAAAVVSGSAEVSLNTPAVQAIFEEGRTTPYAAALTVRDAATGEIHGVANLLIYPAAPPDLPGDDPTLVEALYVLRDGTRAFTGPVSGVAPTAGAHLATKKYVDDGLDAVTAGSFNVASLEAREDALGDDTLVVVQEPGETVPKKATKPFLTAWFGGVFEAIGAAASAISGHLSAFAHGDIASNSAHRTSAHAPADAEANVQADWTQADTESDAYIVNKPTLGTAAALNVPATGDAAATEVVKGDDTRLSIADNAITNAKLAQVATATIKGRATALAGNVEDLTVAQAQALLGVVKSNLAATTAPTIDDDATQGYSIGSPWIDTIQKKKWVLMDPAEGAADWDEVAFGAAGIGGSTGSADNAILRADGTGGATLQASDLAVADGEAAVQANVGIINIHSETNSALRLAPKGTGALYVGPAADGTATGGNARGARAVDLAMGLRGAATDVASGEESFLMPGTRCRASGEHSVAGQYQCVATGTSSLALLRSCATSGRYGAWAIGNYCQTSADDAAACCGGAKAYLQHQFAVGARGGGVYGMQWSVIQAWKTIASTSATNLFVNGSSTRIVLPNNTTWDCEIRIAGRRSDGTSAVLRRRVCIQRTGTTTALVGSVETVGTDVFSAGLSGTTVAIAADDTNEALDIQVTQPDSTSTDWLASILATEITS